MWSDICDECLTCKYYWENMDDDYISCEGYENPCHEYIEIKEKKNE